ncbi:SDR family oxidoreductase [Phycisphaerales bacterium AB-hyl4]|uniref:SDR family oxidoreductase n=1 Tax=Natronomicrosphaera hydrolytica TaxID=3242702 RepID=A0ABV4U9G2_9BACT
MSERAWHEPVLLIGATSGIARALAERLAQQGSDLLLAGRDHVELNAVAADLRLRFDVRTATLEFDALAFGEHHGFMKQATAACENRLTAVVICHGLLVDQAEAQRDPALMRRMVDVNYTSYVSLLEAFAVWFVQRRGGMLVALSSVAGDRGRPSNYLYGSTKAALSAYLQGLRARLAKTGVHVLTVKPGIVDTPMTWGLKVAGPVASPHRVAGDIVRAMRRRRNVLYTPWFWRPIMAVIRGIPEPIFKRLSL